MFLVQGRSGVFRPRKQQKHCFGTSDGFIDLSCGDHHTVLSHYNARETSRGAKGVYIRAFTRSFAFGDPGKSREPPPSFDPEILREGSGFQADSLTSSLNGSV